METVRFNVTGLIDDSHILNWQPWGNICQFHGFGRLGRVDTNIAYKLEAASIS